MRARRQRIAVVHIGVAPAAEFAEMDRAPRQPRGPGLAAHGQVRQLHLRRVEFRGKMERHHLRRRVRQAEGVGALMRIVECRQQRRCVRRRGIGRHRHGMLLAGIAHVDGAGEMQCRRVGAEIGRRLGAQLCEHRGDQRERLRRHRREPRLPQIEARTRREHAPGRKQPGMARHRDLSHAEFAAEHRSVHRRAAAAGQQRQVARVVAALDGHQLEHVDHVGLGKPDHRVGGGNHRQAEPGRQRRDDCRGRGRVEVELAAGEPLGVEHAGQQFRVGHGRLGAAASVAGRARDRRRRSAARPAAAPPRRCARSSRRRRRSRRYRPPAPAPDSRDRAASIPAGSPASAPAARRGSASISRWCRPCRDRGCRARRAPARRAPRRRRRRPGRIQSASAAHALPPRNSPRRRSTACSTAGSQPPRGARHASDWPDRA